MFQDIFGFTDSQSSDVQVYTTGSGGSWQVWNRPRGKSMCSMIVIGSGAGGGGGMTGASGTVRGGGAGGGSGAIARCIIPIYFLPDLMYVQVGVGGAGGAATVAGTAGQRSYISAAPNTTAANIVMQSGAAAATGGAAGSTGGSATAGAAETVSTVTLCILAQAGVLTFIAGKIGAIGGVVGGGVGASNTLQTSSFLNGGAGGGTTPAANTDFAGGTQTGAGIFPTIAGGVSGGATHASGGMLLRSPFMSYGGAGGGTSQTTAGNGGAGAIGSGGGGGGGGVTGGSGGRGGDGLVIIQSW